jgi:hypothetical protein
LLLERAVEMDDLGLDDMVSNVNMPGGRGGAGVVFAFPSFFFFFFSFFLLFSLFSLD